MDSQALRHLEVPGVGALSLGWESATRSKMLQVVVELLSHV